ncbi:MAG: tetratricopeptide repeat protein [Saprospiraceae bacterium]
MRKKSNAIQKSAPSKSASSKKTVRAAALAPSETNLKGGIWPGILAALLAFALYINTIGHQYALDDYSAMLDNYLVKGGLKNIGTFFSTEYRFGMWSSPGSLYRPLALTMFAAEWGVSPDNPALYHFLNVFFYALTGWALWITWRRVMADYPPVLPALATLFFVAHPTHVEVVANIKSRDEIMAFLGCTYALYCVWRYLEARKTTWLAAGVAIYFAALFFKEGAITFVAFIVLALYFFTREKMSFILRIGALFVAPALIFLLIRHNVLSKQNGHEVFSILDNFIVGAESPGERIASALMMCGRYLYALVFPVVLVHDLGYPQYKPTQFSDWRALASLLIFGAVGVWAMLRLKQKHLLSFCILIFLAAFSLYSNLIITIGTSFGERLLYMPSWGFALALGYGVWNVSGAGRGDSVWNPGGGKTILWGLGALILFLYAVRTVTRNPAWYDSYSLYAADIGTAPNCAKMNYHIGLEEAKRGLDEETGAMKDSAWVNKGIASYTRAIELYPQYHDAYGSRGLAYFRKGDYNKAFEDYQIAIKHRPNDARVLSNMGFIYFMIRREPDKAEEVYRKAVQYDPRFVDARRNLGAVLAMKGQFREALEQWEEGLKYDPNNLTLLEYMVNGYRDMGQPEKGKPYADRLAALKKSK